MTEALPEVSTKLFGHTDALTDMLAQLAEGKLAHGWLISGARGTGKATLATHFARSVLSGEEPAYILPDHPVFRRVAARSHADLLVVEPKFD
ncbi:MAG: hypothetical protein K2Q01_09835, partial [Rickettsiales bacterium]|nr:hypothetical protein [Rickettsiales bacterium]